MQSKNFLVTGGAGFIGSNLADNLIAQGGTVRIIDNFVTGYRENLDEIKGDFEFIEGDLNDEAKLRRAVEGVEVVFHEAALPSVPRSVANPKETHNACVNATFKLLLAAKEAGGRRLGYGGGRPGGGRQ